MPEKDRNILIVTDDLYPKAVFDLYFDGYSIIFENDINKAVRIAGFRLPEIIVLDSCYENESIIKFINASRKICEYEIPVLMLMNKENLYEKIMRYYLYIDDFILKPFHGDEFSVRVYNIIKKRHIKSNSSTVYEYKGLRVDIARRYVCYCGEEIMLTKTEYELLLFLIKNKDIVLSRNDIINNVWGYEYAGETNIVDVYVRYLRKKIDKRFNLNIIKTLRGVGYFISS